MGKLSFFYKPESVYNLSLKALKKRNYKIVTALPEQGLIKATLRKGMLKPHVELEIKIVKAGEEQTNLDIRSAIKKNWLTSGQAGTKEEEKLIRTLFRMFDKV
ncbi:MAG: hypothetical protein JNL88_03550 [Bacteroidia bacterium]|nr:hypothetical protein [Bacteroidia bacterium]